MTKQNLLRYSISIIFLLFGALKFFPQLSPAEIIGIDTVEKLTFGFLSESQCILALAIYEVFIGLLLLTKRWRKEAIILAIVHLCLTFTPFIFFPGEVFNLSMNSLSLLGQYIIKNIIIICALLMIYPSSKAYQSISISK